MKIELGKSYITADGRKMDPTRDQKIENGLINLQDTTDNGFQWTYLVDSGLLYVRRNMPGDIYHIVSEWIDPKAPEKAVKHIDQMNYLGYRKGIAEIWDSYRI